MQEIRHGAPLCAFHAALARKNVKIGFLGGSITAGSRNVGGNPDNWPSFFMGALTEKYPNVLWESYNAGIGGTGSLSGLMRAEKEVVAPKCDVVFVEYAVNDYFEEKEPYRRAREGLVRKLRKAGIDVVFLYTFRTEMHADMAAGRMPRIIEEMETLAKHYGVGSVWAGLHAYRAVCAGRLTWEQWLPASGGTLHPEAAGSALYAEAAVRFLAEEIGREGGAKLPLPAPLDEKNYENISPVPRENWSVAPPWRIVRELKYPWFDTAVFTAADGAAMQVRFTGRMIAAHIDFGKRHGVLRYRIDGGNERVFEGPRYDWVPDADWCIPVLLADDLDRGEHTLELSTHFIDMPQCKGSECAIYTFMSVK